jgi:signal transduction histidine kinase/DNA-binding response OmpR family regulator
MNYTKRVELNHRQNLLEFTFAALNYIYPETNQYKYRMLNLDPDTVYAGTDRTAVYRDMKPGEYTFWVTGSNNDGVWNEKGIFVDIIIHPPWYASDLAYAGYGVSFVLLVFSFIRWRTYRLRKEKQILEEEVARRTAEIRDKNEQISEMDRLKTQFFTDISHEIRTPLSLISGPLEQLAKHQDGNPRVQKWLVTIHRNSQRLMQLVDQLLDISRLDSGQMKLVLQEGDILKYIRVLVNEYLSMAESRHIKLVMNIPDHDWITWYDRDKITKVTTNLLGNAMKYTPAGGIITCRIKILNHSKGPSTMLRMLLADTGPGIPQDHRDQIFDRFYRSGEEIFEEMPGTGIGLSLTRELVELMQGEIQVRSKVGVGSVFMVTLPMGKDHLAEGSYVIRQPGPEKEFPDQYPKKTSDQPELEPYGNKAIEILVIEDNTELRHFIRDNLASGYRVTEARDGVHGLEQARKKLPDLVITDVMMPGMDGMALCNALKQEESTSHIPVIMLTAKTLREDRIEGLESGADAYITKPFSMEELQSQIMNLLEQRERLRKKYSGLVGVDWGALTVSTLDEKFLKRITEIIIKEMGDFEFDVGKLQPLVGMSRGHLFRKLKALTGQSPSELIRTMRLKMAAKLIERGAGNITEIAMQVGFSNPSYFAKCFRDQFGMLPREYAKNH